MVFMMVNVHIALFLENTFFIALGFHLMSNFDLAHNTSFRHFVNDRTSWSFLLLSKADILYKLQSILIATYSVHSNVSIKAMVRGIQPTCVCVWAVVQRLFHLLNTMYSLTLTTIIWMIYGVSLSISHSAASWWHMVWTLLFFLAFRRGRAVIKNSVFFCWLPLNVCQHFYFILCHSSYGLLKDIFYFWFNFTVYYVL